MASLVPCGSDNASPMRRQVTDDRTGAHSDAVDWFTCGHDTVSTGRHRTMRRTRVKYRRQTVVLLVALVSIGLRATVGYPADLAELKARQCCSRHCPRSSSATPHRCDCCRQTLSDERLLPTRVAAPLSGGEPMILFSARQGRPRSSAGEQLVEAVDSRASGPPLFLRTHHIQR